jgi:hypothetical protein
MLLAAIGRSKVTVKDLLGSGGPDGFGDNGHSRSGLLQ